MEVNWNKMWREKEKERVRKNDVQMEAFIKLCNVKAIMGRC